MSMTRNQPGSHHPADPSAGDVIVEMLGVGKTYPNGVVANTDVSLTLRRGEIHALVGENGAGKSTLMSILSGLEQPSNGELRVRGRSVRFSSPVAAAEAGIGMVHQEFKLFPSLTVAENLVFGDEPASGGFLSGRRALDRVKELSARYGLGVPPKGKIADLSVGVLQRVEILKALHREAQVLILDEPTAVLTPQEVDVLFAVLRELCESGHSIVVVTHKLREVMQFTDRITVLRDGRGVASMPTSATNATDLARHMTGRNVDLDGAYVAGTPGEIVLSVVDLTVHDRNGTATVADVSLTARRGEIVGIAGVAGSGQSQLFEAIAGLASHVDGRVLLGGRSLGRMDPSERRSSGIAYIPGDRRGIGSAPSASVADNLAMGYQRSAPIKVGMWLRRAALLGHAVALIAKFGIKVSDPRVEAGTLSGGNLQKVVVAREMAHDADLLLVDQPTRGVDVGAIENIHARLREYRDAGHCVLLSTAELSELFALADRILVMFSGRIVAEMSRSEATEFQVGLAMSGLSSEQENAA